MFYTEKLPKPLRKRFLGQIKVITGWMSMHTAMKYNVLVIHKKTGGTLKIFGR